MVQQPPKEQIFDFGEHAEGEEAMLYVDVNLGESKTRIALYSNSNPEQIAQKFAQSYNLDADLANNLTQMLRQQMENAL